MYAVYIALNWVLRIFELALILRVLISWLPVGRDIKAIEMLYTITEPVLSPVRKMMNRSALFGNSMFDFSPIAVFILILVLKRALAIIFSLFIF